MDRPYGDPRRSGYYGHSDRRGIINKSTKVFTREEYAAMLKALREDKQDEGDVPLLSFSGVSSPKPGWWTFEGCFVYNDNLVSNLCQ